MAFVSLAFAHLPDYIKDLNQLDFREVLWKEISGFKICTRNQLLLLF